MEGSDQAGARYRPSEPMEGSNESWHTAWSVGSMEGSNQAGARHGPFGPMKGSDGPLPGFGGWSGALPTSGSREFKGQPRDARAICSVQPKDLPFLRSVDNIPTGACGVHEATAPSTQLVGCDGDWPAYRAWSVGIVGRVKPSWRTAWSVGIDGRVVRPAPWLWLVVGRSDPLRVPRIQGTASGQQDDRFCQA